MPARIGVVTFPGSLDDTDALRAVRVAGGEGVALWHGDRDLHQVDAVILPGGFSYGDYLRCGAIARFAPVMESIIGAANDGMPVLGICNGFQVLCESHLLPGALVRNDHRKFVCRDQRLEVGTSKTRWTGALTEFDQLVIPLKNGEGSYVADRPPSTNSRPTIGSCCATSATTRTARIARSPASRTRPATWSGMMPHPEHAVDELTGPTTDGLAFFKSVLASFASRGRGGVSDVDTVENAGTTPDQPQPYKELGLADDEYQRIREILERRPTSAELAIYSVMWSEHCSYKSSKVHLRQFGEKAPKTDVLLVGMGENAGVVDVGDGWAVTFKIESHNHPSYVEPHQGAATGVGGIVRDILTMGARPVAVLDSLRFGPADAPDTARVLPGVVAGVGGYGNCLGLPNIGGEVVFDKSYAGNPLVNALCVGVLRADSIKLAKADGLGSARGALRGADGRRRHRRRVGAGERDLRRRQAVASDRASRSATRSPRRCSSSAASRSSPPTWSPASRISVRPA